jgi:hypothetical protein
LDAPMPKKKNTSPLTGRNLRIRFIHQFVLEQRGNQSEMLAFVNQHMQDRGQQVIGRATLEADLAFLNRGDFHEVAPQLEREKNGLLYWARLDRRMNKYRYHGKNIPDLHFISDNEQMTLPFLKGLLKPYGFIPAIEKLLNEAQVFFNVRLDQVSDQYSFVVQDPCFTSTNDASDMIKNVIQLLGHINRCEVILLSYKGVSILPNQSKYANEYRFCPLLIRLYQQLFYVSGILTTSQGEKFVNLRVDLIEKDSIRPIFLPQSMRVETFHRHLLWSSFNVYEKVHKAIGVWIHDDHATEEKVIIRFFDWAVNQLLTFTWHPSQRILHVDDEAKSVDVSFTFFTSQTYQQEMDAKLEKAFHDNRNQDGFRPMIPEFLKFPEAGYLLGRFVNFMEFLK